MNGLEFPGFEVPQDTHRLVFTDTQYAEMVVRVRAMSMGDGLRVAFGLAWSEDDDFQERMAKQRELHQTFADHLVEWNLQRNGEPIPATLDGLMSLQPAFVGLLVGTWQVGRVSVADPLDEGSPSGGLSPVESTLTEIPSESLAS